MKINKLTAAYGALDGETVSFHEGLNMVDLPEGTGALWCDFTEAMLYGVREDGQRRGKLAAASGAAPEGCMELTAEGCDITLYRTTSAKDAPMRELSAVYSGTERPVEGIDEKNAGEMLTGVKRQIFRRCAIVGRSEGGAAVQERILSVSHCGEEGLSYTDADERLRQWQRDRRCMRRGMLPELEAKIGQTRRELSDIEKTVRDAEELEQSLEMQRSRCNTLESAVNAARRTQRREALERLAAGRTALKEKSDAHDAALCTLNAAKDELKKNRFGTKTPEQLSLEAEKDLAELESLCRSTQKKPSPVLGALFFILAVVGAALYTAYHLLGYGIAAVVFCLGAIMLIMRYVKLKNGMGEAVLRIKELLGCYGAAAPEEIRAVLDAHSALWDAVRQREKDEQRSRGEYDSALTAQQELESAALGELDLSSLSGEAAALSRELSEARGECESVSSRLSVLRGRIAAAGDPLVLGSTLSVLTGEHEALSDDFDALELAVNTLRDADTAMQSEVSPELIALACRYMSIAADSMQPLLTDGGTLCADLDGTKEALAYLSIRLAVCEAEMPSGESLPLLLDGVLSGMDEPTAAQAIELLREIARKRQVIVFK